MSCNVTLKSVMHEEEIFGTIDFSVLVHLRKYVVRIPLSLQLLESSGDLVFSSLRFNPIIFGLALDLEKENLRQSATHNNGRDEGCWIIDDKCPSPDESRISPEYRFDFDSLSTGRGTGGYNSHEAFSAAHELVGMR